MDEELRADHLLRRRMLTDRAKVHSTLSSLHARLAGSFRKLSLMLAPAIPTAAAISRHHRWPQCSPGSYFCQLARQKLCSPQRGSSDPDVSAVRTKITGYLFHAGDSAVPYQPERLLQQWHEALTAAWCR